MNDFASPAVRMQGMSDEHLIMLFQSGDMSVFEVLVLRHQERIRNFVYSLLGTTRHIDDFAQEIFIKVYQALPRFRFESTFTTWLYRITMNQCRDELRKLRIRRIFFLDDDRKHDVAQHFTPFDHTHQEQLRGFVHDALSKLPLHYRVVLTLRDIEDYTYQEIADVVQCDLGTVKSRIARAREKLRVLLSPIVFDTHTEGENYV